MKAVILIIGVIFLASFVGIAVVFRRIAKISGPYIITRVYDNKYAIQKIDVDDVYVVCYCDSLEEAEKLIAEENNK